jgi:redox-sensitive bicupin YhaK (pirin superfamily)
MANIITLKPSGRDLGNGFMVRRLLPAAQRQSVGPFLFFDHFGPMDVSPGAKQDVRPHPHIGLATVTYLFEGAIVHRDNIGSVQRIEPGAINWMTAGEGIVHSERTPPDLVGRPRRAHGLQLWTALPRAHEEDKPSFTHTPAAALPAITAGDARIRVLIGQAFGAVSPVTTLAETLYLDIKLPANTELVIPPLAPERGLYGVDAGFRVEGSAFAPQTMAVLETGATVRVATDAPARLMLVGGEPLDAHRFIWWNFVSSRRERIAEAADVWDRQQMPRIAGETEWIPLPEQRFR